MLINQNKLFVEKCQFWQIFQLKNIFRVVKTFCFNIFQMKSYVFWFEMTFCCKISVYLYKKVNNMSNNIKRPNH